MARRVEGGSPAKGESGVRGTRGQKGLETARGPGFHPREGESFFDQLPELGHDDSMYVSPVTANRAKVLDKPSTGMKPAPFANLKRDKSE